MSAAASSDVRIPISDDTSEAVGGSSPSPRTLSPPLRPLGPRRMYNSIAGNLTLRTLPACDYSPLTVSASHFVLPAMKALHRCSVVEQSAEHLRGPC
jgi:hypothetical protein